MVWLIYQAHSMSKAWDPMIDIRELGGLPCQNLDPCLAIEEDSSRGDEVLMISMWAS